ncbi:ATP-binding protein [Streptomyces sp. NPDC055078]
MNDHPADDVHTCVADLRTALASLGITLPSLGVDAPTLAGSSPHRLVSLGNCKLPPPGEAGPEDERGRGLALVDAVAARWGVKVSGAGKTVWCEVRHRRPRAERGR